MKKLCAGLDHPHNNYFWYEFLPASGSGVDKRRRIYQRVVGGQRARLQGRRGPGGARRGWEAGAGNPGGGARGVEQLLETSAARAVAQVVGAGALRRAQVPPVLRVVVVRRTVVWVVGVHRTMVVA